jgi:hypothetical protein
MYIIYKTFLNNFKIKTHCFYIFLFFFKWKTKDPLLKIKGWSKKKHKYEHKNQNGNFFITKIDNKKTQNWVNNNFKEVFFLILFCNSS